ncbi:hypothetical protein [Streptomyces asiaticus]
MKRAFVGMAGPLCYDYKHALRHNVPNPILENATGLILSYDEIWFLSRDLCPLDLHEVEFVKFVEDYADINERASVAAHQFSDLYWNDFRSGEGVFTARPGHDLTEAETVWTTSVTFIRDELPFGAIPDHHGRVIEGIPGGPGKGEKNVLIDLGIAAALDLDLDVIFNCHSAAIAHVLQAPEGRIVQGRLNVAEHVTAIRTIDYLGPSGAFHESLNDLRMHPRVTEFRQYLAELDTSERDLLQLAKEVEAAADRHARDALDRYLAGRGKIRTIGAAAVSTGANAVQPGLGSALTGMLTAAEWLKERKNRKEIAWAPFILDARRPR